MKNVILITGNGFNYLIQDIIKNIPSSEIPPKINISVTDVTTGISNITNLWKKFDKLFSDLKAKSNLNEEELIRMIHAILDLFSNMSGFKQVLNPAQVLQIQQIFDNLILTELKNISEEFRQYHNSEGYKAIKKLFPEFGSKFKEMLNRKCHKFNIYTTNYDGVLDTLLTKKYPERGFIFSDCLSNTDVPGFLAMEPAYLNTNKYILAHIHGSYLYERYFGRTYKQRSASLNSSPIMVFNNPDLKKTVINNDNVLNAYYNKLEHDMQNFDKIIIIGNSMKTEPHIKNLISNHFSKRKNTEIVVCSPSPADITKELKTHFSNAIIEINSSTIKTDMDLIAMIENNI